MRTLTVAALALSVVGCSCPPATNPPPTGCIRRECQVTDCGELLDNCGGIIRCGSCPSGQTCGGGGTPNQCGSGTCDAKTCLELGKNCDFISDGCSRILDCGRCMRPSDCGRNGTPNVCGGPSCVRATCGSVCGMSLPDDCGGFAECDAGCTIPFETCGGGAEPNRCGCTPRTCADLKKNCGPSPNGCGAMLECGTCGPDAGTCGGGGYDNVCGTCGDTGGRVCSASCWCWDNPRPVGGPIGALAGAASDLWLFSGGGTFSRWTPSGVVGVPSQTRGAPRNAWARSPDDIYAVTNHAGAQLLHWDGTAWTPETVPILDALLGVWGAGGQVWAVGANAVILRKTAGTWSVIQMGGGAVYEDVWASSPNDVWAAGTITRHFNGTSWVNVPELGLRVTDVHGTAANDVWAVDVTTVRHFDGSTWSISYTRAPMRRVWAIARDDVWIGGAQGRAAHWDGMQWTDVELGVQADVTAIWAGGPDDVWMAAGSALLHRDASGWNVMSSLPVGDVTSVAALSPDEAWAVAGPAVLHFEGRAWKPYFTGTTMGGASAAGGRVWLAGAGGVILSNRDGGLSRETNGLANVAALHAVSANEAWAVGNNGPLMRTDGDGVWSPVAAPSFTNVTALWAGSEHDVWVAESPVPLNGRVRHLDDAGWHDTFVGPVQVRALSGAGGTVYALGSVLARSTSDGGWERLLADAGMGFTALWARGPDDVFLGTVDGALMRWTGGSLVPVATGMPPLSSITGVPGSSALLAGGRAGTLVRVDSSVEPQLVPFALTGQQLRQVVASGKDDVWALGTSFPLSHTLYRYDGRGWRAAASPPIDVKAIWAGSPGDAWAAGSGGRVSHWDGGSWSPFTNALGSSDLNVLWGAASNDVWVANAEQIAHWDGTAWSPSNLPIRPSVITSMHGTARDDVWIAGSNIFRWNGAQWQSYKLLPRPATSIWCASRTRCWTAGNGLVFRFNGSRWDEIDSPSMNVRTVWGRGPDDVYFFCTDGDAFRWDGVRYTRIYTGANAAIMSVATTDAGTWAVGADTILFNPK